MTSLHRFKISLCANKRSSRGFTLLEVIIALSILAISLTALLQAHSTSLDSTARARDMTVATLLLRSKMIDIERRLFQEGFSMNTEEDDGDFRDEEHPEIKWASRISEVQFDLTALSSLCSLVNPQGAKDDESKGGENDCENQILSMTQMLGGVTEELARSMRAVELVVTWPDGRYEQTIGVRSLLTRDDFGTEQQIDQSRVMDQMQNGSNNGAAAPATGTTL